MYKVPVRRALFLLKNQSSHGYGNKASGLRNSAQFVSDMLNDNGIPSKLVIVTDNNDIDREVALFKPTHVFIEALWVVPEKFTVLAKLHPDVTWVVRIHSQLPFLALESVAVEWIRAYVLQPNVLVAANSEEGARDLRVITEGSPMVVYLPNFYPTLHRPAKSRFKGDTINIGSFGAIRPFKNQLLQAAAAIRFANKSLLTLNFHINATRVEKGDAILSNLRALFKGTRHSLIEDSWLTHEDFLTLLRNQIDLSMLVSFTETFSIVTADAVSQGVPIVVSDQVSWTNSNSQVSTTNLHEIVRAMQIALRDAGLVHLNQHLLARFSAASQAIWINYLNGQ